MEINYYIDETYRIIVMKTKEGLPICIRISLLDNWRRVYDIWLAESVVNKFTKFH